MDVCSCVLNGVRCYGNCRWLSVLNNAKEATLMQAFKEKTENPLRELTKSLVHSVRRLPHNNMCCDCGAAGNRGNRVGRHGNGDNSNDSKQT